MLDILIVGGTYPDFAAGEMKQANIGIKDGVIAYIGEGEPTAENVLSAAGRIVSPGFIDIHMHEESFKEEGLGYGVANMMLRQGVTLALGGNCGIQRQPIGDFKSGIEKLGGSPINYMMLAGYNEARYALGMDRFDKTDDVIRGKLRDELAKEIQAGAVGISFGIEYDPAMTTEDILHGIGTAPDETMLVAAHYRNWGPACRNGIEEMIYIQSQIAQPFQISHLGSGAAYGVMKESLDLIHEAKAKHPKLDYDTYPYDAFCTFIGTESYNEETLRETNMTYEDIMLTEEPYLNVRLTKEIYDEVREKYPMMLAVGFAMVPEEVTMTVADPLMGMIGSDAIVSDGNGHPRCAGTFPRLFGKYVREDGALSLYDTLRKCTLEPAKRLNLSRKGRIEEGTDADITIFDPETIQDLATYTEPSLPPAGIDWVLVNGAIACEGTTIADGLQGRFISFADK